MVPNGLKTKIFWMLDFGMSAPKKRTDTATPVAVAAQITRPKLKAIWGQL
jgi:hypothetical protein